MTTSWRKRLRTNTAERRYPCKPSRLSLAVRSRDDWCPEDAYRPLVFTLRGGIPIRSHVAAGAVAFKAIDLYVVLGTVAGSFPALSSELNELAAGLVGLSFQRLHWVSGEAAERELATPVMMHDLSIVSQHPPSKKIGICIQISVPLKSPTSREVGFLAGRKSAPSTLQGIGS